MDIPKDDYKSLTEIYEIAENIVEVVRSSGPPMLAIKMTDQGIVAEGSHSRRFRAIATRVLRGPTWTYLANIEELIDLVIDGREARVWREVTSYFSTASADSIDVCIDIALGNINCLIGRALVFEDPNF